MTREELFIELQTAWDATAQQTKDDLFTALYSVGPEDKQAVMDWMDENGTPLHLGGSAQSLWYQYQAETTRRQQTAAAEHRRLHAQQMLAEASQMAAEAAADGLRADDYQRAVNAIVDKLEAFQHEYTSDAVDTAALLTPAKWNDILSEVSEAPEALETSYRFPTLPGDEDQDRYLRFPVGALSLLAAPTGHGKTTLLLNVMLDAVEREPNKRHWIFNFEESRGAILTKLLAAYIARPVSKNPLRSIRHYARTGSLDMFAHEISNPDGSRTDAKALFREREKRFAELVNTGVLNVVTAFNYDDADLIAAISAAASDRPGFIGIDYVGLIPRRDTVRGRGRNEELKAIALDLKNAAIDHQLAIVGAVQFNRTVVHPALMAPGALQDSADLERAANLIIGMWNGSHPAQKTQSVGKDTITVPPENLYLRYLKYRDGRVGRDGLFAHNGTTWTVDHIGNAPPAAKDKNGKASQSPTNNETSDNYKWGQIGR